MDTAQSEISPAKKSVPTIVTVAAAVIVIAGLKVGAPILAPFALALFLAFLSFPLVFSLQAKGWPSWVATLATLAVNFLVVGTLVFLVFFSLRTFDESLPDYQVKTRALFESTQAWLQAQPWFKGKEVSLDFINPEAVFDVTRKGLRGLVELFSGAALIFVIMLFALLEASSFPGKMRFILGYNEGDPQRFHAILGEIAQYLWVKTLVSLATGVFVGVGAWIVGVDFPILWGLLTFILNYIPTIGSILPAIPSVLLALVQLGWTSALAFLGVTVAANVIFGSIVEPVMMGKRLGLSTLVVTLSLVFWAWMWGPIGMLLSVPLTMVFKIVAGNIPEMKWIAIMLSDWNPSKEPDLVPVPAGPVEGSGVEPTSGTEKKD